MNTDSEAVTGTSLRLLGVRGPGFAGCPLSGQDCSDQLYCITNTPVLIRPIRTGGTDMYSESDLEAAVAPGVLTPAQAMSFRNFVAAGQHSPAVDEEHFRLLTGFNDIFVAIAAAILLVAVGWIGHYVPPNVDGDGPVAVQRPVRRRDRLGPRRIFHPAAAHGPALDPAAACLRRRRLRRLALHLGERDRPDDARSQQPVRRDRRSRPPRRSRPAPPGCTGAGSGCRSRSRSGPRRAWPWCSG